MSRKSQPIKVVLHMPESSEDIEAIQEIFDKAYCRCVAKKLENSNLTVDEKRYVVEKLKENIMKKSMPV